MLYGTDPEFFSCIKRDGNNFVISPALLETSGVIYPIGGDLKHPIYIDKEDFSWMMDGVAWELTLKNPISTPKEMKNILDISLECLETFIDKLKWKDHKLYLIKKPVVSIDPNIYLEKIDDERIFQGFIFGCDKDEDAIETNYVCETLDVMSHLFRYAGGHQHFSGMKELHELPRPAIQLLSIFVGNYCILNTLFPELEKQRATTYGRPGRFRLQVYKNGDKGIEYRTPSNSWTSFSLNKIEEMYDLANTALNLLGNPSKGVEIIKEFLPKTINSVINCDQVLAKEILEEVKYV